MSVVVQSIAKRILIAFSGVNILYTRKCIFNFLIPVQWMADRETHVGDRRRVGQWAGGFDNSIIPPGLDNELHIVIEAVVLAVRDLCKICAATGF